MTLKPGSLVKVKDKYIALKIVNYQQPDPGIGIVGRQATTEDFNRKGITSTVESWYLVLFSETREFLPEHLLELVKTSTR